MPRTQPHAPHRHPLSRSSLRRFTAALSFTAALLVASAAAADEPTAPPGPRPQQAFGYVLDQPPPALQPSLTVASVDAPPAAPRRDAAPRALPSENSAAFDVAFVTQVPIMIGGQATLELPYRILLQGEVGMLPPAFVNAVDGVLVSSGAYDSNTSDLVRNGLKDSLIVRFSGGFRPFADHGFEIMGGYTLASLGGGMSARHAIEAATGVALPAEIQDAQVPMHTTIHNVHVSLGWRWVIADHFLIRASVAYLQSVASSSHVDLPAGVASNATSQAQLGQVNQVIDKTLDDTYKSYVKLPVFGLSMGYRF